MSLLFLDIALSLIVVFVMLSVFCSSLLEWYAQRVGARRGRGGRNASSDISGYGQRLDRRRLGRAFVTSSAGQEPHCQQKRQCDRDPCLVDPWSTVGCEPASMRPRASWWRRLQHDARCTG